MQCHTHASFILIEASLDSNFVAIIICYVAIIIATNGLLESLSPEFCLVWVTLIVSCMHKHNIINNVVQIIVGSNGGFTNHADNINPVIASEQSHIIIKIVHYTHSFSSSTVSYVSSYLSSPTLCLTGYNRWS